MSEPQILQRCGSPKRHCVAILDGFLCVTDGKIFEFNAPSGFVITVNLLFAWFLQCNSKGQGEKEMYTLGITNFPIPGEPGFPLNAIYAKPANKQEEGKADPGPLKASLGSFFTSCFFVTATRKITVKTESSKSEVLSSEGSRSWIFWPRGPSDSPGSTDPTEQINRGLSLPFAST